MFMVSRFKLILVLLQVGCLGIVPLQALDLTPWLPKEKPMELNSNLGVSVVSGLKISKAPLKSWEISNAVEMTVDSSRNILICGPGFLHKLEVKNGEYGQAQKTVPFTNLGMDYRDIVAVGADVYAGTNQGLWRFTDNDGDGISDGHPKQIQKWQLKKNHHLKMILSHHREILISGVWDWVGSSKSAQNGGKILRYNLSTNALSNYADGFHSPTALGRNLYGDTFCYDKGQLEGRGLPEIIGSKFYHVSPNGFHGYSEISHLVHYQTGHYPESAPYAHFSGLNDYTDFEEYRHYHLPVDFFYGGLFGCDWMSGKLIYFQLNPIKSSYIPQSFIVAEAYEKNGWSPRCVCVTPEGKLLVISSGLSGPGGLYIVQSVFPASTPNPKSEIQVTINQPQPFSSWSYKEWGPLAHAIDEEDFLDILIKTKPTLLEKLAALDCLIVKDFSINDELFDELKLLLNEEVFGYLAQRLNSNKKKTSPYTWIKNLIFSHSNFNIRKSLDVYHLNTDWLANKNHINRIIELCYSEDEGIKYRARSLIQSVKANRVSYLLNDFDSLPLASQVVLFQKFRQYKKLDNDASMKELTRIINSTRNLDILTGCLSEVFYNLELDRDEFFLLKKPNKVLGAEIKEAIIEKSLDLYPTSRTSLNIELSRLMAIMEIEENILAQRLFNQINPGFSFARNVHYLRVALNITNASDIPRRFRKRIAQTILKISRMGENKNALVNSVRIKKIRNLLSRCFKKWDWLEKEVTKLPGFPTFEDGLALQFVNPPNLNEYVKTILAEIKSPLLFDFDKEFVRALTKSQLPNKITTIGQLWNKLNLRKPLLEYLSSRPEKDYLNAFIESLDSGEPECQKLALTGITNISPQPNLAVSQLAILVRSASRETTPLTKNLKEKIWNYFIMQVPDENEFKVNYEGVVNLPNDEFKNKLVNAFITAYPNDEKFLGLDPNDDPKVWKEKMKSSDWESGDPELGKMTFTQRNCIKCHGQNSNFGPSLKEISELNIESILNHTIFPHESIDEKYKTWMVQSGQLKFMGFKIAASDKNVIFTINSESSVRLNIEDLNLAEPASFSLMPGGLLAGLSQKQIIDLMAYIKNAK